MTLILFEDIMGSHEYFLHITCSSYYTSVQVRSLDNNKLIVVLNTRLHAQSNNSSNDNERRKILSRGAGAALSILLGGTAPAEASYTAYTRREEDWQQRSEKGGKSGKLYCKHSLN